MYDTRTLRGYAPMSMLALLAVLVAGFLAGTINAVVGSGSLITFPVLLALGFPPVVANVSNTVGLSVGNVGAVLGYRLELRGQLGRLAWLSIPALAGAILGATLLLRLPQGVFRRVVPGLIVFAVVLVIVQPVLSRRFQAHGSNRWLWTVLPLGVFLTAVYGGYFGAAQGVILISLLAILLTDPLQHLNALKNAVILVVNGVAAAIFIVAAHVAWQPAVLLAISSIVGGRLGASAARRLSPVLLRGFIVLAGLATVLRLVVG